MNEAMMEFKKLKFSPSTKDEDILNTIECIENLENLNAEMYVILDSIDFDDPEIPEVLGLGLCGDIIKVLAKALGENE